MKLQALFAVLALAACSPSVADAPIADQWRSVTVEAAPVDLGVQTAGQLRFRGGLNLTSSDAVFGGISGMEVLDGGRVVAISDNGDWFEAQLQLDAQGTLTGFTGVRTAFMRDERGEMFADKEAGDSEDVAQLADGRFAVSFEQTQSIRIYDLNRDGPFGAAQAGPRLADTENLPDNIGLEALTATADGALLIGAEGGDAATTPLWLARLDARAPVAPSARYPTSDGYSLTSLDRLPNGDFVALERFYAPVIGARARITRFSAASLAHGTVDKQVLAELAPPMPVDNFEAIGAVRMPDGVTRLYIASDNNFNTRQRTLIYAFDIVEGGS